MGSDPEFEILPADDFPTDEAIAAKSYWSAIDTTLYRGIRPWSATIAAKIVEFRPRSVLEFGCNSGGNLEAIRQADPSIETFGLDINGAGLACARSQGLSCGLGDETTVLAFPALSFDLVFTLSVIDHLPDPLPILCNLMRITRKSLLLREPWLGKEGRVVKNRHRKTGTLIDTTPYSYSWDYQRLFQEIAPDWDLSVLPAPRETNIGRYYNFYIASLR